MVVLARYWRRISARCRCLPLLFLFVVLCVFSSRMLSVFDVRGFDLVVGVVLVEKRQFLRRKRKKGSVSLSLSR